MLEWYCSDAIVIFLHVVVLQECVHPSLELWHPVLKPYFGKPVPLQCSEVEENWIRTSNGSFHVQRQATQLHGAIACQYVPLYRGQDDFTVEEGDTLPIRDGEPVLTDFCSVECTAEDGQIYSNIHSSIAYNSELQNRHARKPLPSDAMGLNILMFGFDSMSRMTWMRNLPKSHEYFTTKLGGHILEGYNIVGDGTPQALLPILTGKAEPELAEARRGHAGAGPVDGHPWIWKELAELGYVTQWGEDSSEIGTFTYRMLGFKQQPVDHYMRPFYMKAEREYHKHRPYCLGSVPRHANMLRWVEDFYEMYRDKPKFSFVFHAEFTHDGYSQVQVVDEDFLGFLQSLDSGGHLNNTLLILMSDHGARFQEVRQTVQGKYEERMPYVGLRLPPEFAQRYPQAYLNLRTNTARLTTPYDIHDTFQDILHYRAGRRAHATDRGISLFQEIPLERSCAQAGIETHWCACLKWRSMPLENVVVRAAAGKLLEVINSFTAQHRYQCHLLHLENITVASQYTANDQLLHFKKSSDVDGRVADLTDNMRPLETFYQVTVRTQPGGALYEATVKHYIQSNHFMLDEKEISRINKYGSQPHCVQSHFPHLRPYCYCHGQVDR